MKEITDKVLKTYAKKYGVDLARFGDIGWMTHIESANSEKMITISVSPMIIFFSIYPLLEVKCKKCRPQLTHHLLLLNSQTPLVKYSVDADWSILLSVEYPAKELTYNLFVTAMDALAEALEKHYSEIVEMAKD